MSISADNFHQRTKIVWNMLAVGKKADEKFKQLQSNYGVFFKSNSHSSYIIIDNVIYRYANHWGNVASCTWPLDQPIHRWQFGKFVLAKANFSDFIQKPIILNT